MLRSFTAAHLVTKVMAWKVATSSRLSSRRIGQVPKTDVYW